MPDVLTEGCSPVVSIVLLAYNHLDYTKKCLEILYKYTTDVDFELITINNGSTDGTEEFFISLPNTKKISFTQNVGVHKAVNCGFQIAEGKYTLNLSNDIVVTPRWLRNLVACAESDDKIAMVVPVCNSFSNEQIVELAYTTFEQMQQAAELYNISNPALWEERLRLTTYTCLFRTDVQKAIGGFDEDFHSGAYDDDSMSFRLRRMGYKLILAKDTYVHHYGSVTFGEENLKNNPIARSQSLFYSKFGIDARDATGIDKCIVALADYNRKGEVRMLGIGSSCAASLLQIKNVYRSRGVKNVALHYLSETLNNLPDLATVCDRWMFAAPTEAKIYFGAASYDIIVVESETEKLKSIETFYKELCGMLKNGGRLITTAAKQLYPAIGKTLLENGMELFNCIDGYYYAFDKRMIAE